jgi:gliding motility-associated-like protein
MTADGTVIIDIAANVCSDAAGNLNTASTNTDNQVIYDNSRPSVDITQATGQADPTNSSPINFTATFSETVTGFDNADITLSGTANPASVVVTGSGTTYNIAVSGMTADGTVIIDIAANVCSDAVGNLNTASTNTDNQVIYDNSRPSVAITSTESASTELSNIPITIEFSEPVQGFSASDINLTNSNISNLTELSAGEKWTANLNPINQGIVEVSINSDIATDNADNGNTASNIFSISYTIANHAPVIQNQQFSINEDSNAGSLIGTVIATDEDNDNLNFEIISGNIDDAFSIDMSSGEISLTAANIINYENQAEYQLTIQVTDDDPDPLSAQAIITIKILDIDEPFVANNIITPNDIRNKYWIIEDVHNFADFKLTIRTATGQVVYETVNYQNDWAGTYNNQDLPTGTYYYTMVSTINRKSYSGFINLIQN